MKLPDPPLLLVTDRRQARRPLPEVVAAALAAGCRWVSVREKDLPEDEQIALVRMLLPMARRHGARLTLHGDAALAKIVWRRWRAPVGRQRSRCGPRAARTRQADRRLDPHRHRSGSASIPAVVDYALAGPAFETPSKPGYGPEIGRKGLAEIARASRVPVLAIGGLNAARAAEVLAAGPVGIAVMGGVMRAADPGQEMRALLATVMGRSAVSSG